MKYTIWRISEGGEGFPLTTTGSTTQKDKAMEKARSFNDKLQQSDPESKDRFVVRDEKGRDLKISA